MHYFNRRSLLIGSGSIALIGNSAFGETTADQAQRRAAIIDTPDDTRPWLGQLKEANVKVVARYYARSPQCSLAPRKRFAFNDNDYNSDKKCLSGGKPLKPLDLPDSSAEFEQLLKQEFAIVSVYQYNSGDPRKFLFGLNDAGDFNKPDQPGNHIKAATKEGRADATAALDQAKRVGQTDKTAIYFGLDFDLEEGDNRQVMRGDNGDIPVFYADGQTNVLNKALKEACAAYFKEVKNVINGKFALGIYGSGFSSRFLRNAALHGEPLIKYTWLAGGVGHSKTTEVLRKGDWHLFQNCLDRSWFTVDNKCGTGLDVDTNIQNPGSEDFGAWWKHGAYTADSTRALDIYNQRRPCVAKKTAIIGRDTEPDKVVCYKKKPDLRESILRSRSVHILGSKTIAGVGLCYEIDVDEDGVGDGFCLAKDFAASLKETPDL